jgi:hypothetical protein
MNMTFVRGEISVLFALTGKLKCTSCVNIAHLCHNDLFSGQRRVVPLRLWYRAPVLWPGASAFLDNDFLSAQSLTFQIIYVKSTVLRG